MMETCQSQEIAEHRAIASREGINHEVAPLLLFLPLSVAYPTSHAGKTQGRRGTVCSPPRECA